MTTTTINNSPDLAPAPQQAATASASNAPPQFATRADRDAYYRAKYYAERGLNADGTDPRAITISMTPAQARAFYSVTTSVGRAFGFARFVWNMAALFTVLVFAAMLYGALTA